MTHEFGHAIGLKHTSIDASFDGQTPMMSTCHSASKVIAQDDVASLAGYHSELEVGSDEPMTANLGFERSPFDLYWGKTGGDWWQSTLEDSGVHSMRHSGRYKESDAVFQTTQWIPNTSGGDRTVWARANFRGWAANDAGTVVLQHWSRKHDYKTPDTCATDNFPINRDLNEPGIFNPTTFDLVKSNTTIVSGTGWHTNVDTSSYTIPSTWHAADLRVRVVNNVERGAAAGHLILDNVRGME